MTAIVNPLWIVRDPDTGKPVHNAKFWAEKDGRKVANWLDAKFSQPGCETRRTNISGEVCNSGADGRACCFHLKEPGDYIIKMADERDRPLGEIPYTVPELVGPTVFAIRAAESLSVEPTPLGVTIYAAPQPTKERPLAEDEAALRFKVPPGSNIAGAIKDLISIAEPGSKPER